MNALFVSWIVAVAVGFTSFIAVLLKPPRDGDAAAALRVSGLAIVPSILPLVEFLVRAGLRLSYSPYVTKWPFVIGTG